MNVHPIDQDSQEIARITHQHRIILKLKAARQNTGHTSYGIAAGTLVLTAVAVWALILGDAWIGSPEPPTRAFHALVDFAVVLGISAAIAAFTSMIIRDVRRRTAEQDTLNEYEVEQQAKRDAQQVEKITAGVLAALREQARAERVQRFNDLLAAEGTTGAAPGIQPSEDGTYRPDFGKPRRGGARTS